MVHKISVWPSHKHARKNDNDDDDDDDDDDNCQPVEGSSIHGEVMLRWSSGFGLSRGAVNIWRWKQKLGLGGPASCFTQHEPLQLL